MRKVTYAVALIFVASIHASAIAQADERLLFPTKFSTYQLSSGYDSATDSVKERCVTSTTEDVAKGQQDGLTYATVTSSVVETKNQLVSRLSGTTDLGFKTFKYGRESAASFEVNDYSAFVLLQFEVEKGRRQIHTISFSENAKKLLAADTAAFRKLCGNEFFVAEFGGGYLYGLLEVVTTSSVQQDEVKSSLGGLFNGLTFDEKSKSELRRALENKRSRLWIVQSGGASVPVLSNTIEDFLRKIELAAESIVKAPNARGAYRTWPYEKVFGFTNAPLPAIARNRIVNRDAAIDEFYKADRLYRNLRYVVSNPAEFEKHDAQPLRNSESKLRTELDALLTYIQKCSLSLSDCDNKPPVVVLSANLPKRLRQLDEGCERKRSAACGVESFKLTRSVACGVDQYVSRRDPVCGVESYGQARTAVCGAERYKTGPCILVSATTSVPSNHLAYRPPEAFACPSGNIEIRTARPFVGRPFQPYEVSQGYCNGVQMGPGTDSRGSLGVSLSQGVCQAPEYGVELWKQCSDISHGTLYRSCRNSTFGVESFAECRTLDHGVDQYRECLVSVDNAGKEQACGADPKSMKITNPVRVVR